MDQLSQSIWSNIVGDGANGANEAGERLVLGMDFGSSNSCVSVWRADKNRVKIIRNKSLQGKFFANLLDNFSICVCKSLLLFCKLGLKTTPSLIQFSKDFKDYKIGSECDESMDNVIFGLKAYLMKHNINTTKIETEEEGRISSRTTADGDVLLTCYDRESSNSADTAESEQTGAALTSTRKQKEYEVQRLISYIMAYLKECAEIYLTRKPIKPYNVIDGSSTSSLNNNTTNSETNTSTNTSTTEWKATPSCVSLQSCCCCC